MATDASPSYFLSAVPFRGASPTYASGLWRAGVSVPLVFFARRLCLRLFSRIAVWLAQRLHGAGWKEKLKQGAPAEFAVRIFYALEHLVSTLLGGYLCGSRGWLTGYGYDEFFTPPWPRALQSADMSLTRVYYEFEASLALESSLLLFGSALTGSGRRDTLMMLHHVVTLILITASWRLGVYQVGAVVMWLHAVSDIGIDLLKAAVSIDWDAVLLPIFLATVIGWVGLRLVFLPCHVLLPGWCVISDAWRGRFPVYQDLAHAWQMPEFIPGVIAWLLLWALLMMHTLWLRQLLKKAMRVFVGAASRQSSLPDTWCQTRMHAE